MSQPSFESTELPALQPRTHCVLISRDPNYIYAYWDYTEEDINRLRHPLKLEGGDLQLILRVYDTTLVKFKGSNANHSWDLEVGDSIKNWHIHVWQDNADYCVELGIRGGESHFIPLMRSNTVHTPPKTTSSRNDLIWQDIGSHQESKPYIQEEIKGRYQKLIQQHSKKKSHQVRQLQHQRIYQLTVGDIHDYYMKLFATVSARGRGKRLHMPSIEDILKGKWRALSWQKVHSFITCPDLIRRMHPGSSMDSIESKGASENLLTAKAGASEERLNKRKFFFEIWTELLVYGRTEDDATVLLNDKGIKLNPDGSFSLRYALPDCKIPLKFIAQSSDGMEQRHIYTHVEREKTIGFPKMLKDPHG